MRVSKSAPPLFLGFIHEGFENTQGAKELSFDMTDPRWLGIHGWVKMQNIVTLSNGIKIVIHFVYNKALNLVDGFKFK